MYNYYSVFDCHLFLYRKLFSSLYVFLSDGVLYLVTTDGLDFDTNQRSISSPYNVRIQSIDHFKID